MIKLTRCKPAVIAFLLCCQICIMWFSHLHLTAQEDSALAEASETVVSDQEEIPLRFIESYNKAACKMFKRYGDRQIAVCLGHRIRPNPDRCLVYSFNPDSAWSFEEDLEHYGCRILLFDPSLGVPHYMVSHKMYFYSIGLSLSDVKNDSRGWETHTFSTIRQTLRHDSRTIDVLSINFDRKQDSKVLEQLLESGELGTVKQLAIGARLFGENVQTTQSWYRVFKRLENSGLERFDTFFNFRGVKENDFTN